MHLRSRLVLSLTLASLISLQVTEASSTWPGLRGPSYDGAVHDARLFEGAEGGLEIGWKRQLGSGYSVVTVDNQRIIAAFQAGGEDVVAAFDIEHGDELWRQPIGDAYAGHDGSHDGPVATPVLADGVVYALSPRGGLFAFDAGNGKRIWSSDLVETLGAEAPFYGFSSSPLLADGVLVVQIGAGEGKTFAGFAPETGELLWTNGTDNVRYQSPIVAAIGGEPQVLVVGNKTLSAIDPKSGTVIWTYEHSGDERDMGGNTIVPVPAGDGRILLMNTHPTSVMLQITKGDSWEVTELWSGGSIKSSYVPPVFHDGYLYGMNSKIFTCVDAATGEMVWRSRDPGDGFPTLVGDHLVIMNKPGTLRVAEASPEGYREIASLEVFQEHSWSAPAYAGGHLYVRSMRHLARIDTTSGGSASEGAAAQMARVGFGQLLAALETAEDKSSLIDRYLDAQESFPIIEDSGAVHFLYRGEANDVGIVGDMIGYRREDPMTRVDGTDLYYYSTRLEPDASVGYGFIVDFADPIADPLNPTPREGAFGEVSWFAMPAWEAPDFVGEAEASRQGTVEEVTWESAAKEGQTRKASVYLPAGYETSEDRRYPTLYFLHGLDALEQGAFKNTLDNLIGTRIESVIAVFVLPDPENEEDDLWPTETYLQMLVEELVPKIDAAYRIQPNAARRAVAGAGRGGDTALSAAFHHSDVFGRVGSLWPIVFNLDLAREIPDADQHPLVIYQAWGTYHLRSPHEAWDQVADNRKFFEMLREAGYRPAGGEVPEGVGWAIYSRYSDDLLTALFPVK